MSVILLIFKLIWHSWTLAHYVLTSFSPLCPWDSTLLWPTCCPSGIFHLSPLQRGQPWSACCIFPDNTAHSTLLGLKVASYYCWPWYILPIWHTHPLTSSSPKPALSFKIQIRFQFLLILPSNLNSPLLELSFILGTTYWSLYLCFLSFYFTFCWGNMMHHQLNCKLLENMNFAYNVTV